jgi:site-specific DNA recombinase
MTKQASALRAASRSETDDANARKTSGRSKIGPQGPSSAGTAGLRAIVGARVSHLQGPQKVSHQAQLETSTKWAKANGYKIVGSFEDLGVSASVRPDERPDLGKWLTEEGAQEWDAIVWAKMDRAFRSTRHCVDFAQWAEDRHKVVVFAEDGLTLDYRPGVAKGIDAMMAELFVYIGSFFAQLELNRFKTRALDGHRVLRGTTRWASGVPPLGFQVIDHPSGKGKGLGTDPHGRELLHGMKSRLLDGAPQDGCPACGKGACASHMRPWSFVRITAWLNDEGHLTNMDRARVAKGQEPKRKPWTVSTVIEALTSPRTQGLKIHKGETVLDPEGEPIRLGPPTFDPDTWAQIQRAASVRQLNQRTPTETANPMLGVGYCGACGASLAQQVTRRKLAPRHEPGCSRGAGCDCPERDGSVKVHRYYRCGRTPVNCPGVTIRADEGDELLEQTFLDRWGDKRITRRVFIPGEDRTHELQQVTETIARLRREQDAGILTTPEDEEIWTERMRSLVERRDKLSDTPVRGPEWVVEETDRTYREAWPGYTDPRCTPERHVAECECRTEDHRQLLVDKGVRFVLHPSPGGKALRFDLYDPEDGIPLPTRVVSDGVGHP